MRRFFVFLVIIFISFISIKYVFADELDDVSRELNALKSSLQSKEADFDKLNKQLSGIKLRVSSVERELADKEKQLVRREKMLNEQRKLLNKRIHSYYKNISKNSYYLFELFLGSNFEESLRVFFYQQILIDEDKRQIIRLVRDIVTLEDDQKALKSEQSRLLVIKNDIDKQSQVLGADISTTRQKVAQLSARQQSLVAAKLASIAVPRSAETSLRGCSSDLTNGKNPGFSPRLGFFSFGAPHGNGMNQYGARGRAKDNQNEEQILSEYYPNMSLNKGYDQNAQINVDGHGTFSIEDYVKRIYEMPDSWTENNSAALKAQAVAARSYALNSMQRNGHICTTEACQVFRPEPKGGNWEQAVNATAGWVLMDGGSPGFTQYASTHGGYVKNLNKFDGSGGNPGNFGELKERAYDRESPWFHCDWGARSEYDGTAWLKTSEVADIANVIMLAQRDSGTGSHLSQTDKGIPDTWDAEKVKSELRSRGGNPFNNVSSVSIGADFGSGLTNSVSVSGDAGSVSFSGSEWKDWFNLRAPANIQIKSRLYNVEIQ